MLVNKDEYVTPKFAGHCTHRRRNFRRFGFVGRVLFVLVMAQCHEMTYGWGDNEDGIAFSVSSQRNWLYSSTSAAIYVEGCVWSYVDGSDEDGEDVGCMEDESEDGTTYWYQMANCKRANVAYSVYADDSSSSITCNSNTFKESFVTKDGLAEFAYIVSQYDQYSSFSEDDVGELPMCEEDGNGYYQAVGCAEDGTFTIDTFSDQYCLERVGTYDSLSNLNSAMSGLKSCYTCYSAGNDEDLYNSLCGNLIPYSESCSDLDSPLCTSNSFINNVESQWKGRNSSHGGSGRRTIANKMKYALGSLFLISSFILFLGILFTNRRRRRAMMRRKMRSSARRSRSSSRKRASKSRSRSRGRVIESVPSRSSRKSISGRSLSGRSKSKSRSKRTTDEGEGGILA